MYLQDENNRWALFDSQASAEYFYNRLSGSGPYRFIYALWPAEVARKLAALTA